MFDEKMSQCFFSNRQFIALGIWTVFVALTDLPFLTNDPQKFEYKKLKA